MKRYLEKNGRKYYRVSQIEYLLGGEIYTQYKKFVVNGTLEEKKSELISLRTNENNSDLIYNSHLEMLDVEIPMDKYDIHFTDEEEHEILLEQVEVYL